MPGKVLDGPQLIRVGERSKADKKYATDEYLLAPPGTIVAPRLKGEKPTPENAAKALLGKAIELGMIPTGGETMGPSAFRAFASGQGAGTRQASVGPPMLRKIRGAATGAAVNPVADALNAIKAVGSAAGVDDATAAGMLNTGDAPLGDTVDFAEGTGSMSNYLQQLLAGGQLTGPDLMLAQLAFMQNLGYIDPRAIGVTDPAKFRSIIGEGKGTATIDLKKQMFNESLYGFSQSSPQRGNVPQYASQ